MLTVSLLLLLICFFISSIESQDDQLDYFPRIFIISVAALLALAFLAIYLNALISPVASVLALLGIILGLSFSLLQTYISSIKQRSKRLRNAFVRAFNHLLISDDFTRISTRKPSIVALISIFYLFLLNILAFSLTPVNGDSQIYNLSRVLVSLLSRSVFLSESSIPTQAFHAFAHDYLYTPDLLIGSSLGLGLLSSIELIFTWILIDIVILHAIPTGSLQLKLPELRRIRSIARIILISMPALFYQATITKNDLILAPLSISVVALLYSFRQEQDPRGVITISSDATLAIQLFCGFLLLYLSKGYGIVILTVIILICMSICKLTPFQTRLPVRIQFHKQNGNNRFLLPISASLAAVISVLAALFIHNRTNHWADAYSRFTSKHAVSSITTLEAIPLNLSRTLLESFSNIPLPFHFTPGDLLGVYRGDKYLPLSETYSFGGLINEDISWPGILFNVAIVALIALYIRTSLTSRPKHEARNSSGSQISLPLYLGRVGCICSFIIAALVYWQPYSSRFFISSSILLVPIASFALGDLNRSIPTKLRRFALILFLSTGLLSASIPIAKQYYVLLRQSTVGDYYLSKSMNTSSLAIDTTVASLSSPTVVVCSRDNYSASLELLKRLRSLSLKNSTYQFRFPRSNVCKQMLDLSTQPSSDVLFYGGGQPPRLKKPLPKSP